jgi:hypothetical protein
MWGRGGVYQSAALPALDYARRPGLAAQSAASAAIPGPCDCMAMRFSAWLQLIAQRAPLGTNRSHLAIHQKQLVQWYEHGLSNDLADVSPRLGHPAGRLCPPPLAQFGQFQRDGAACSTSRRKRGTRQFSDASAREGRTAGGHDPTQIDTNCCILPHLLADIACCVLQAGHGWDGVIMPQNVVWFRPVYAGARQSMGCSFDFSSPYVHECLQFILGRHIPMKAFNFNSYIHPWIW